MVLPDITTTPPDTTTMIRDTVNDAVNKHMTEIKALLAQTATKQDIKELQQQIDKHDTDIREQKHNLAEEVHKSDLFQKFIRDSIREMEVKVSRATDLLTNRDEQYLKRMERLDDRLTANEQRASDLADEIHEVAEKDGDTRMRMEQAIPPIYRAMFGDPAEKRPGVITTLEATNARIDTANTALAGVGNQFVQALSELNTRFAPLVSAHQETVDRKRRWKERRQWVAGKIFSWKGMTAIGASLPFVIPWAIRWLQAHVNLTPAMVDFLNQFSQIMSSYAAK